MGNPDWAEIFSAKSTFWGAIASGVAAIATVVAATVAGFALKYARQAAEKAGAQAEAALDAAKSAREQVELMRREMQWNEPQPSLFPRIEFQNPYSGPGGSIFIDNVGDVPAFDIEIAPMSISEPPPGIGVITAVRLYPRPILAEGKTMEAVPLPEEKFATPGDPWSGKYTTNLGTFLKAMIDTNRKVAALTGDPKRPTQAGIFSVNFANSRGATFQQSFHIVISDVQSIEVQPVGSMVRCRTKPLTP